MERKEDIKMNGWKKEQICKQSQTSIQRENRKRNKGLRMAQNVYVNK
jgi:hypothetical protein